MALVNCPECGKKLSNDCVDCLRCGCKLDNVILQYGLPNYKRRRRKVIFRVISIVLALLGLCLLLTGTYLVKSIGITYDRNLYYVRLAAITEDYQQRERIDCGISIADNKSLLSYYYYYTMILKDENFYENYIAFNGLTTFQNIWEQNSNNSFKSIAISSGVNYKLLEDCNSIFDVSKKCESIKESMNNTIMDYLCSDTEKVNAMVNERINKLVKEYSSILVPVFVGGTAFIVVAIILFVKSFKKKYNP